MPLPDGFLQELKVKTDINDVISPYVTLKKRGNTYVGLCPFHNEKTPSFTVYPATQSFYCFGCGAGGDSVNFVKKIENLDYIDAVKLLAQRAGMQMPEDNTYDDGIAKLRRRILEINRESAKYFHSYMLSPDGKVGLDYFLNRGLTMKTISHFGLGYAPDKWDGLLKHLKSKGFSESEMLQAGVVARGKRSCYDIFRNRVMTPIIDVRGNVIAFGGRVLDDSKPKYINTGDTRAYKKTYELFGLNFAKDSGSDTLILCEGYMDVIAMHQAGFTNAVAGCGTALTPQQVQLIGRYAKEVILAYDADGAGQKAVEKAIGLFNQTDLKVKIPSLVGGKDPDEIIKTYGRDKFKGMLEGASNEIEFHFLKLREKYNLNTTQGKIDFLNDAVKVLADVSPIEKDLYTSRLADELGVEKNSINIQLESYSRRVRARQKKKQFEKIVDDNIRQSRKERFETSLSTKQIKAQERILGLLLKYPDCSKLCDENTVNLMSDGFYKTVFKLITNKINNQESIDLSDFNEQLSDEEIGRLSGIIARFEQSTDSKAEFKDCITVLKDERKKADISDVSSLSDDDFRNLFKNNT